MCFQFPGTSECGLFGECGANNTCVCEPGWRPSLEFVFFPFIRDDRLKPFIHDEEALLSQLPCSTNDTFLRICFTLCLFANISALFFHLPALNTARRLKRQSPLLSTFLLFAITSLIRLSGDGLNKTYTDNVYASISYALAISSQSLATTVFVFKYTNYHLLKLKSFGRRNIYMWGFDMQYLFRNGVPYLKLADLIFGPFLAVPAALENRTVAGAILYAVIWYYILRALFVSLITYFTISGVARDMQGYVKDVKQFNLEKDGFYHYCNGASANMKWVVLSVLFFCAPTALVSIVYMSFYGLESIWSYAVPILGFAWPVMSISIGYLMKRNADLSKKSKLMKKNNAYVTKKVPASLDLAPSTQV